MPPNIAYYSGNSWSDIIGTIALFGVLMLLGAVTSAIKRAVEIHRFRTTRCAHGVRGAMFNSELCPACVAEKKRLAAEYSRQQEELKRQQEAEQLKRFNDYAAKVRLPEFVKAMDPEAFQRLVWQLLGRMGYRVEQTPFSGDNGSDGFLYKNNEKVVLQCKRVRGSVGEPVLRDLFGTMHANKCTSAIVVTVGTVSKQARAWASGKPIRIIQSEELQSLLRTHFQESTIVPLDFTATGLASTPCPRCGRPLRLVHGKHGPFIGCTGYTANPPCRYTAQPDENGLPRRRKWLRNYS